MFLEAATLVLSCLLCLVLLWLFQGVHAKWMIDWRIDKLTYVKVYKGKKNVILRHPEFIEGYGIPP
jgi:hypothetical protein